MIGRAVAARLLGPGLGHFALYYWNAWNTIQKGSWYRVTGRRGNAKECHGLVGKCIWIGDTFNPYTGNVSGQRVGLLAEGSDIPVWVSAKQITRIPPPAAAVVAAAQRDAARAAVQAEAMQRPAFAGAVANKHARTSGDMVVVIAGKDAGKRGEVFWRGEDRKQPGTFRLGVRTLDRETLWVGERDVVGSISSYRLWPKTLAERASMYATAEMFMLALDRFGYAYDAAKWSTFALELATAEVA
jgi:hypothetical protein